MIFAVPQGGEGSENDKSTTYHIIDTESTCPRTNKRKLKMYLTEMGVPTREHKTVLKKLGFWGAALAPATQEEILRAAHRVLQ
jgi:hypothetical protein|tara:strand:- start:895 stop:1143 length:249 start_codon:yes stop_codon:yes gene_type:complete